MEFSFEAIGLKKAAEQAYESLAPGGIATIVGMVPLGQKVDIDGFSLLFEKRIQGCFMGSNRFRIDMPRLIEFYEQGRLNLDDMISKRGKLEDVNEAFRAMKAGEVARTVLMFDRRRVTVGSNRINCTNARARSPENITIAPLRVERADDSPLPCSRKGLGKS